MVDKLHLPFCNYMQMFPWNCGIDTTRRKMATMPRGHFKSTVCSVSLPLWLICHNRNETVAIISSVEKNCKKWARQIKHIIKYNKWFKWIFDEIKPGDKWDQYEFSVERDETLHGEGTASFTISSIKTGQASAHYHHIILDDLVNEKTAQSETELETAVELYKYVESLGRKWDETTITLVGTPYGRGDVIEYAMEHDVKGGERLYWHIGALGDFRISPELEEFAELKPVYTEGEPIFPEVCPAEKLEHLKNQDIEVFYLQYLCKPYEAGRNGFKLDLIREYTIQEDGYTFNCDCHKEHKHDLREGATILLWDPAATEDRKNCRAALILATQFPCGCRFLIDEWLKHTEPDAQVKQCVDWTNQYYPYLLNVGVEVVGMQKTLHNWLVQIQNEGKIPAEVTLHELKPRGREKDARIKSQQMPVANGLWHRRPHMAPSPVKKNMLWELEGWPYRKERDGIDAGFGYCEDMWALPECQRFFSRTNDRAVESYNAVVEQIDEDLIRGN